MICKNLTRRCKWFSWVLARCLENFPGSPVATAQPSPRPAEQRALQGGILTSSAPPTCCASPWMSEPACSASASVKATVAGEKVRWPEKTRAQENAVTYTETGLSSPLPIQDLWPRLMWSVKHTLGTITKNSSWSWWEEGIL